MVLSVIEVAGTRLVGEIVLVSMSWPYSSPVQLTFIYILPWGSVKAFLSKQVHALSGAE